MDPPAHRPFFTQNAREGVHLEDSLYAATYEAFKADRYAEVDANTHLSESRFPLGLTATSLSSSTD